MNNCFSIYHTSWITRGPKSNFICDNILTKAIFFFFGCSEVNSTWLITSELANPAAREKYYSLIVWYILSSIILRGIFQRISQLWDNAHTLNLESCLLYLSPILSQFLDFIHCMVFYFIFLLRDNVHTLYSIPCVTMYTLYTLYPAWQCTHSIQSGFFFCVPVRKDRYPKKKEIQNTSSIKGTQYCSSVYRSVDNDSQNNALFRRGSRILKWGGGGEFL